MPNTPKPVKPLHPAKRWWNSFINAIGTAIGNAKFGQ